MPYAGVGHRFAAVFIDCLVFLGTFVVISLLSGGTDTVTADGSAWVNWTSRELPFSGGSA